MTKIQIPATIEERIRQAADDLVSGEDANWHLAMLTYESTLDRPGQPRKDDSRLTMTDWCQRIREASGRRFADATGRRYKSVWSQFGRNHDPDSDLLSWAEAWNENLGTEPGERFANADAKRATQNLASVTPEVKLALADELLKDPDTAERIERRFIDRAAHDPALASRIERAFEEFHPTPAVSQDRPSERDPDALWSLGSAVYGSVFRERERVGALVSYLQRNMPLDEEQTRAAAAVVAGMEAARRQLTSYEDEIRKAMGIDVDATFARLVGEAGGQS